MNIEIYIFFLIITILINIIFILLIACFGHIFIFFIRKKTEGHWNLSRLEYLCISFTIGLSLYFAWSYIVDLLRLFNFYTIYLPILLIDLIFIFYKFKHYKFNKFIKNFNLILKKKKFEIAILTIVILLLFIKIWNGLFGGTSLLSRDPYFWTSNVLYLLDNSHLNYDWLSRATYPDGFVFYGAGNLLISMNKTIGYFFMKFGGVPTFFLYIIMMYLISRRLFKRKYFIYVCLILLVSYNYLIYRTILFLPSNIVNILIFVSIMIIFTDIPNYFLGFIIPTAFLLHPISAIFLIGGLFIFYIVKLVKNRKDIKNLFKEIIVIVSISFLLLIPFLINIYVTRNKSVFYLIEGYLEAFIPKSLNNTRVNKNLILLIIPFINFDFGGFNLFLYDNIIGIFVLLSLGGLFLGYKKQGDRLKDGYIYLKICLILLLLVFSLPYLLNIEYFINITFYNWTSVRIVETFSPQLILLSCLFLEWITEAINKIYQSLKLQYKKFIRINEKSKNTGKYLNLRNLNIMFLILIFFSAFSVYIDSTKKKFEYYYIYDHSLLENIIYVNEFVPINKKIAVYDLLYDGIDSTYNYGPYRLLYSYELCYYNETDNYTYNDLYSFCTENDIEYLILRKFKFDEINFLVDFDSSPNFIEIYPNTPGNLSRLYRFYND